MRHRTLIGAIERYLAKAREAFTGAHARPPTDLELASMMNMSLDELHEKEYEIRRSDLTSLSSLAVTGGDTGIELIETIHASRRSTRS